jgi:2,4-dienoyl-CoA reductase-like NADH-dependent reductase (Old Yellow Enzyme family)
VRAVRTRVAPGFCVGVKLNSADFQRGGFSEDDAKQVLAMLNLEKVDLVELSGGSYESPAMQGRTADGRTLAREAYFLEFARDLAQVAKMPLMTTGGIARRAIAEQVLQSGVAIVGMGTALAAVPDLPRQWQAGREPVAAMPDVAWRDKALVSLARMALVRRRLHALADGSGPLAAYSPVFTLVLDQLRSLRLTRRYRAWSTQRG